MITGFNTDIEHDGVTYHVQTEDKGLTTPLILSLVYDRGTILASKRSPYDDLLIGGFDEKALIERLQKQHKLICAAVRGGRIEDLKRMTMKDSASRKKGLIAQKEVKSVVEKKDEVVHLAELKPEDLPIPSPFNGKSDLFSYKEKQDIAVIEDVRDIPIHIIESPMVEVVEIIEEEVILPAEAVEIISDSAHPKITFDDRLKIELHNEAVFKGGERRTIVMKVRRGNSDTGLIGAEILVKIIGSSFRPLIFHAKTDNDGVATVHLQLPHFRTGRAAVLIKAISEGEEIELRRRVLQG